MNLLHKADAPRLAIAVILNPTREEKMSNTDHILREASVLSPFEKAQLIDQLISSLDEPDKKIDELWAQETENRIEAYDRGELKAVSLKEVLQKYR